MPMKGPCFSTKSASCPSNCRRNCCAFWKTANISASEKRKAGSPTHGSLPRPIAICARKSGQVKDFKTTVEAARKHLQTKKGFLLDEALRDLERSYVEAALDITRGNLSQAAKLLGIHRTTLYSRMQNYASGMEEGT